MSVSEQNTKIRVKKIEKVLWICDGTFFDGENSFRPEVYLPLDKESVELYDINHYKESHLMINKKWIKVPQCIIEVDNL